MKTENQNKWICFLGIGATLGLLLCTFPLLSDPLLYLSIVMIFSFIYIWYPSKYHKKILTVCMLFISVFICFFNLSDIVETVKLLYNATLPIYDAQSDLIFQPLAVVLSSEKADLFCYLVISCFTLWILLAMYYFIVVRKQWLMAFLLSFGLCIPSLLHNILLSWFWLIPLLIYWVILFIQAFIKRKGIQTVLQPIWYLGIIISVSGIVVCTYRFMPMENGSLPYATSWKNQLIVRVGEFIDQLQYGSKSENELDLVRAGNRFYTGSTHLELTASRPETLYLKEISAAIYENNTWSLLADEIYENEDFDRIWRDNFDYINRNSRYLETPMNTITIRDVRSHPQYTPYPYYLSYLPNELALDAYYDAYIKPSDQPLEYAVWNENSWISQSNSSSNANSIYRFALYDFYLQVPKEITDTFTNDFHLSPEQSWSSIDALSAHIREFLKDHAVYDLQPGSTPEDQDFIRYFLLENKRGYCVHFASTATLLFRYYGIPARYVEGYRVERDAFEDGYAEVHDRDAHAWVEIFDDRFGWIPIEVTPAAPDNEVTLSPEEQQQASSNQPQENTETIQNQQEDQNTAKPENEEQRYPYGISIICVLIFVIAGYGQRRLRLAIRYHHIQKGDNKQKICALHQYLCCLDIHEVPQSIEAIIAEAEFSQHQMHERQYREVAAYVKQAIQEKKAKCSRIHRLYDQYILVLY